MKNLLPMIALTITTALMTITPSNAQIRNVIGAIAPATGTQSYDDGQDEASVWCNNVVRELSQSLQLAEMQESRGNFTSAAQILVSGLEQTDANQYLRKGPMTARAISRAIELAGIMQSSVSGQANGQRSFVEFVANYYEFIIKTATQLDLPFYIPHLHCGIGCGYGHQAEAFESNFIQFAKNEVQIVLDTLTVKGGQAGVFPVGSTSAFLNVLSKSIQYASEDLQESPFVASYACTIKYLNRVVSIIQQGGLGNEPDTVNYVYQEVTSLLSQVQTGCGCFNWSE